MAECVYSDYKGRCTLAIKDEIDDELVLEVLLPAGAGKDGYCYAEDDPDPTWCDSYESAYEEED